MASFCPFFCPFLKMHKGEKVVLGVIWRKNRKKEGGRRIPKPGTQVEYKGKKYVSLKELSKDINVPYYHYRNETGSRQEILQNHIDI